MAISFSHSAVNGSDNKTASWGQNVSGAESAAENKLPGAVAGQKTPSKKPSVAPPQCGRSFIDPVDYWSGQDSGPVNSIGQCAHQRFSNCKQSVVAKPIRAKLGMIGFVRQLPLKLAHGKPPA
jgi:hypothetical protein